MKNNALSVKKSSLLKEWDYKKNEPLGLDPSVLTCGSSKKVWWKCNKCGNEWPSSISHRANGSGCPNCARERTKEKRRLSHDEFVSKLRIAQPNIEAIDKYINSRTKIKVRCKKCENIWKVVPSSLLHGTGCPKCNKRYRRNTSEYIKELQEINPNILVLGEYLSANSRIRVRCIRCNHEREPIAISLLRGNDCPKCTHSQTSVIEKLLYNSLVQLLGKEEVSNRDRKTIGKELDILVPSLKLAIEFGAWYWHYNHINEDYRKELLCNDKGIKLITIYEGCPNNISINDMKNAVCFKEILSSDKKYIKVKQIIEKLCDDYQLDKSIINRNWNEIIKKSSEESRKKDAQTFSKELSELNPTIRYISGYSGAKNPVKVECLICGLKWNASSAYDLLNNHGCPECSKKKRNASLWLSPQVFREKLQIINPNIEPLEDYKGLKTPILCRCKKCNTKWRPLPSNNLYRKRNCPSCSKTKKLSHTEFVKRLKKINKKIEPLDEYKNMKTHIRFKCLKCNYIWETTPASVLNGRGCPKCVNRALITPSEFKKRVSEANPDILLLEEYKNKKTRIKCRCKKCGYEWEGIPGNLLRGSGCKKCAGTLALSDEEFKRKLSQINPRIISLEKYINGQKKILFKCLVCNYEWKAIPRNILNGHGCSKCKAKNTSMLKSKKVKCLETGTIYSSVSEAKKVTGISTISDNLNKRTKTAGGYHWEYYNEQA